MDRRRNLTKVAAWVALAAGLPHAEAQPPIAKVVVEEARTVSSPASITLVGTITPFRTSRVASKGAAKAEEVPVRQGDSVAAGDVLCQLDDETLTQSLREAEAVLSSRKARHEELLAGTRPQELRRLEALWRQAEANLERWRKEAERVQRLYTGDSSNEKEVYDTRANLLEAEASAAAAEAEHLLGVEGPRKEVIAQAAFDVAAQEAVVRRLERDLAKLTIRAPFAGYVSQRLVEVGEWVDSGDAVVELIELSRVLARVDVPEAALPFQRAGGPAKVHVEALGRTLDGMTRHIVPKADRAARTFPVEIELDNASGALAAGMFVRATLPAGDGRETVAVPKDAVVVRDGVSYVGVVTPNPRAGQPGEAEQTALLLPVTVGMDVDDWITLTSDNVRAGMRIVIRGNEKLMPFPSPVMIVDRQGNPAPPEQSRGSGAARDSVEGVGAGGAGGAGAGASAAKGNR